jgi:large subunit ribosomal protein L15
MPPAQDILIVPDEVGEVSVEQLCKKFYVGDVIDVAAMKEKGLLDPDVNYVKITSEGDMTKKLTVSAHMFERTAAKMILLTGGDIAMITE